MPDNLATGVLEAPALARPSLPVRSKARRRMVVALTVATVAYLVWLVGANRSELDRAVLRFQGARSHWLFTAIGLEVLSQACAVAVQHRLLRRAGTNIKLATTSHLVLAQNAIGMAVPGGVAVASAYSYRQIRRRGSDGTAAAWVVAASNVVGMVALATFGAFTATGTSVLSLVMGIVLLGALSILITLARAPRRLARPLTALTKLTDRLTRRRHPDRRPAADRVDERLARLTAVHLAWHDWTYVALFALLAVGCDWAVWASASHAVIALPARCLRPKLAVRTAKLCAQFRTPTTSALFVAYAAGQAAIAVPFLPGGIGLVESFMTATLTATKVRPIAALSAVLLYRLISYWGVLVIGAIAYLILRRRHRKTTALAEVAERRRGHDVR